MHGRLVAERLCPVRRHGACEGEESRACCIRHPDDPDRINANPVPEDIRARCAGSAGAAPSGNRIMARMPRASRKSRSVPRPAARVADQELPDLPDVSAVDEVDTRFLQSLLGYNARRAALAIIERFLVRMAQFKLRPVEFSVMSVIHHNPGVTSRQLCAALNLLPPNLVGLIQSLDARGLLVRLPHPLDGRAVGLHPTPEGRTLMQQAEAAAREAETAKALGLTAAQHKTLLELLQKLYR